MPLDLRCFACLVALAGCHAADADRETDAGVAAPTPIAVGTVGHSESEITAQLVSGVPGQIFIELRTAVFDPAKDKLEPGDPSILGTRPPPVDQVAGTFDLAQEGTDLFACAHCVYVQGLDGAVFLAVSGTLTLSAVDAIDPSVSTGSLANVVFAEQTVDAMAFTSAPLAGGRGLALASFAWDNPSPEGTACGESTDCDDGWVCDPAKRVCDRTAACGDTLSCPSGQACIGEAGAVSYACFSTCAPFTSPSGCPTGQACAPSGAAGEGICETIGSAALGHPCGASDIATGCVAGARCVDENTSLLAPAGICAPVCDFFGGLAGCDASSLCSPEGVCVPAADVALAAPGDPCSDPRDIYCGGLAIAGHCAPAPDGSSLCAGFCLQAPAADGSPTAGMTGAACGAGPCGEAGLRHAPAAGVVGICRSSAIQSRATTPPAAGGYWLVHKNPDSIECMRADGTLGKDVPCGLFTFDASLALISVDGESLAVDCGPSFSGVCRTAATGAKLYLSSAPGGAWELRATGGRRRIVALATRGQSGGWDVVQVQAENPLQATSLSWLEYFSPWREASEAYYETPQYDQGRLAAGVPAAPPPALLAPEPAANAQYYLWGPMSAP